MYNYNYLNDDWYKDVRNNLYNANNTKKDSLFTPAEGYDKGNLFSNLYDQYKNYKPETLRASNERERLFLELSRMHFAAHELNLYLDLNPNDRSMIALFNDYRRKVIELTKEYESKYGPLTTMSDSLDQTPFMWEKTAWPWEDRYYV